jgi:predicted MPP superfamily phosphohydrolase
MKGKLLKVCSSMKIFKTKKRIALFVFLTLILCGLFAALWAFVIEPNRVVVRENEIKLPEWPTAFNGLRIVAVSDLHAGARYIDGAKLEKVVAMINETQPDLIVILGDFIARDEKEKLLMEPEVTAIKLSGLKSKLGVYAVLGNHDWLFDGERVKRSLAAAGIRVLESEVAEIEKDGQTIWLLGVPDFWTRQPIDLRPALQKINKPGPVIALTHNPDVFPILPSSIILTLAGHTHGGQVSIPFIGRPIIPSRYGERYAIGHIEENGRHLFVTPGIGTTGIPVRFRVPPEISVITVESN